MKLISQTMKKFGSMILAVSLSLPMAVSCYDDSELREQIDMIVNQIFELEQKLNSEIKALKSMLNGNVLISDVSIDVATGITTVTLSDGTELNLLPEQELKSYVTYMTLGDGQNYWAYIDEDGTKQLFLDKDGKAIPVISEVPEVIVEGEDTYLVIGGVSYPLSGNSVFSNYVLHTDEYTGEVYAVTFTFGEDMTFTITVDGAAGVYFVQPSGFDFEIIDRYYVPSGTTARVQIQARGVQDFVIQKPDGWKVSEYDDVFMGAKYLDITAPTVAHIEQGIASAEGDLKVMAVLEGGKATVARLSLSSEPFLEFSAAQGKLYAEMNNGLQKYVCGVCPASEYDEEAIFSVASGLLDEYNYPAGYNIIGYDLNGVNASELAGGELVYGEEYVFWAFPAIYFFSDQEAYYYLEEGTAVAAEFRYYEVAFELESESFTDAEVSLKLAGADNYYIGISPKASYFVEDVLLGINYTGLYTAKPWTYGETAYTGSVFSLAGVTPESATEYVAWVVIAEDGKIYEEQDVVTCEFETLNLVAGGTVAVTAADPVVSAMDAVVTLSATGAEKIYYAYLTESDAKKYTDNDSRALYLFENGFFTSEASVEAKLSDSSLKRKPQTKYTLFAVATAEGKYGEVIVVECTTTEVVYNDLKVEMEMLMNDPGNVIISISSEGSEGFLYWVGKTSDNTWKSSNYLGGSAETAQAFMYTNPDHSRLTSVMEKYPVSDGQIVLSDLDTGVDHVIVAMAKSSDGSYSKATELRFETRSVSIGTVVTSDDSRWAAATPTVEFNVRSFYPAVGMMSGSYSANITIPLGYTGYVLFGTDAYINEGDNTAVISTEDMIVKVMEYADKSRDTSILIDENAWVTQGYPYGYEFYKFPHGSPTFGNSPGAAVVWGSKEFHDARCHCEEEHTGTGIRGGIEVPVELVVLYNDGNPILFAQPHAIGSTTEVIDKIFIVCQDAEGNCYETYVTDVPFEYFRDAEVGN